MLNPNRSSNELLPLIEVVNPHIYRWVHLHSGLSSIWGAGRKAAAMVLNSIVCGPSILLEDSESLLKGSFF